MLPKVLAEVEVRDDRYDQWTRRHTTGWGKRASSVFLPTRGGLSEREKGKKARVRSRP
jgi:hypothetical protein